MSDKLGPLAFGEKEGEIFLGRDMGHVKNYSEATAIEIDNEIRRDRPGELRTDPQNSLQANRRA